jgi:DNA-binding Lrp family transcriptional regulator
MATGRDNKQISIELKTPLSTIQRRTKNILRSGIVNVTITPSYKRLGIKKGLLHVYLRNGDIKDSALKVSKMDGILSSSVHVGNSDVVGDYVYEDSEQLIDTISNIKHMENVERVLWSEEVYSVPVNTGNVLSSLKRMWVNDNSNGNSRDHQLGTKRFY